MVQLCLSYIYIYNDVSNIYKLKEGLMLFVCMKERLKWIMLNQIKFLQLQKKKMNDILMRQLPKKK